ncbi:MAG: non-canonical purine NTP pyrophosphatase [Planctomycetota bacterium]|nr:MAG: non-canonical purine NTP pyrophosphatase [Planctomycetota bacterium]
MPEVLVATSNPHKLDEIRAILAPLGVRAIGLSEAPVTGGTGVGSRSAADLPEPIEDADSFAGNAEIKAVAYARLTGRPCLADDSGLEVDALGGAPGVRSARYAGVDGPRDVRDAANNDRLLRELAGVPRARRGARFVCCMCLASPAGAVLATSRGEMAGVIADAPRGANGFGYDPLLELPDGRTSAELPPDEKNRVSHRAAATRAIAPELARLLREPAA